MALSISSRQIVDQSQATAVHTPAEVPLAPRMFRSTKLCGAMAMLPVTVQLVPDATTQLNAVSAMLPAGPERSVTVTVFDCCE